MQEQVAGLNATQYLEQAPRVTSEKTETLPRRFRDASETPVCERTSRIPQASAAAPTLRHRRDLYLLLINTVCVNRPRSTSAR